MQMSKEESVEDPAIYKPNLTQCQPERKSAVISDGGKTVTEQEPEFATKRGEEGISVLRYFCDIEHPISFTSLLITLTYQS